MKYPLLLGAALPVLAVLVAVPLSTLLLPAPQAAATTAATPATASPATPVTTPTTSATTAAAPSAAASSSAPVPSSAASTVQSTAPAEPSPTAQYAEQMRGVIDQAAAGQYAMDASYAIGTLPLDTPPLAEGEHADLVRTNCSVCHATTFITSQPPLPASTWHDEVYKMKEKYGATFISDENADKIIAYLSAHYTPETRKATTGATGTATP